MVLMPFETIRWCAHSIHPSPSFVVCVLLFAHFFQLTVYLISLCHTIYLTVFINILLLFFISCFLSLHRLHTCTMYILGWLVGINNNSTHKINGLVCSIRSFCMCMCMCVHKIALHCDRLSVSECCLAERWTTITYWIACTIVNQRAH